MGIHPLALTHNLTRDEIEWAIEHSEATIAIDNGPTRIMIIGPAPDGRLLEVSGVIRDEDVLVVHADRARPDYEPLVSLARQLPGAGEAGPPPDTGDGFGWSVDGLALTPELIAQLQAEADSGYDVATLRVRLRTGRPAPLSVGEVFRIDLDPALYRAGAERADNDGVPIHEVMRRALRSALAGART